MNICFFDYFRFFEVFVNTPLNVCESRDVRGLYKKARDGSIKGFTGVTQAYEEPENPDLIVQTEYRTIRESMLQIVQLLQMENVIPMDISDLDFVSVEIVGYKNRLFHFGYLLYCSFQNNLYQKPNSMRPFWNQKLYQN